MAKFSTNEGAQPQVTSPTFRFGSKTCDGRIQLHSISVSRAFAKGQLLSFHAIAAQLEFLAWRDAQLVEISFQLEDAFPALLDDLAKQVEQAGKINVIRSTVALKSSAEAIIQNWATQQLQTALRRAEAELDLSILQLPGGVNLNRHGWEQVSNALPALAGVGLIGASVAAIPTVVSFATVTTSFLTFWGTA